MTGSASSSSTARSSNEATVQEKQYVAATTKESNDNEPNIRPSPLDPEKASVSAAIEARSATNPPAIATSGSGPFVLPPDHPMHPSQFPDGGAKAWLCVAGASATLFCSFGWINVVGVFQNYYETGPLHSYSASTVGWVVSTEVFFMLFMGPWVGLWYDNFGPKWLLIVGTFLHVFGLMMTSLSTEYYQFFLSQGVCSAIGASMIFSPGMASVSTWFFKRRGLALGLVAAGSSLGGVLFPIIVSRMIPRNGFPWAMRTCAFLILGLMVFANLTVRPRVPPMKRKFDANTFFRPLKEPAFLLLTIGIFIFYFGMFPPFAFVVSNAAAHGMSLNLAQYLVSILNAASIFGRSLPGFLGDKVGRFNTMSVMCAVTGVLILGLWIPATNNLINLVFAPFFGFFTGAAIGLLPAMVAQISPLKEIGTRTGLIFGIASISALTSTPIAGALVTNEHGKFLHLQIFCGVFTLVGAIFIIMSRSVLTGWKLKGKV